MVNVEERTHGCAERGGSDRTLGLEVTSGGPPASTGEGSKSAAL